MVRAEFDERGSGARRRASGSGGGGGRKHTRGRHARRSKEMTTQMASTAQPRGHTARPANVPATSRAPLPGGNRSPWAGGAPIVGAPSPALELTGGMGLLDVLLDLAGAEGVSARSVLAAWQREQDRLSNHAWRRPGGLTRPAGL